MGDDNTNDRRCNEFGRRSYDDLHRAAWDLTEQLKQLNGQLTTIIRVMLLLIGGGLVAPEFLRKVLSITVGG